MKTTTQVLPRTFKARNEPVGSAARAGYNADPLTSEYMPSHRYLVRRPAVMSDGSPNPSQAFHDSTFPTKRQAEAYASTL